MRLDEEIVGKEERDMFERHFGQVQGLKFNNIADSFPEDFCLEKIN